MSISPGTRFGAYEVAEPIGSGGMGEVWRAHDTKLKRDVAIKILPQAFVDDGDRLARFQREAEILASLNHPNIAQVYGLEDVDGQTAIVMELVEGPTLADRIALGPIPPDEAMGIGLQVAAALEAAHERQIVHRDLKPANIKVKEDGTVKVLDFGISKPIDPMASSGTPVQMTPAVTQTGIILGTAAYMSPEQAQGKFVDQRTDIWAFGCLLFEMLTGQPAFGGENVMAILARVIDRDTDLSSMPKTLSPAVRHTIRLCLQKNPKRRIADIRDVRLALEGTFESELPHEAGVTAAAAPAKSRIGVAAIGLVAGLVIMAAVGAVMWPDAGSRPVVRSAYVLPQGQNWSLLQAGSIAVSPAGDEIAYTANGALFRRRLNELNGRIIPGSETEGPLAPVYSVDGKWLLYRNSGAAVQLRRIDVNGGTPLTVVQSAGQIFTWTWNKPGMIEYCIGPEAFVIAPEGGEPRRVTETEGVNCYSNSQIPGTDWLLYERRTESTEASAEIVVQSLASGEERALFPGRQPTYLDPYIFYYDASAGLVARHFNAETLEYGDAVSFDVDMLVTNDVAFRVAANGTLVYIEGSGNEVAGGIPLTVMDRQGNLRQLGAPMAQYQRLAVSPDGTRIAVEVVREDTTDIFIYEVNGNTELRQLTFEGANTEPVWSPDGADIIFSSDRGGRLAIWRKAADGRTDAEPVTAPAEGLRHIQPAFTADGKRLAWTELTNPGANIWIKDYPDGEPELLVSGEGQQFGIAFSPDGAAMAYSSDASGPTVLMVEPYPKEAGSSGTRVSEVGVDTLWPVWSRDSRTLSYQIGDGGIFYAVDINTSTFAVTNRRSLGVAANPRQRRAASFPGDEFLVVAAAMGGRGTSGGAAAAQRVIIVENWLEEVTQRVPLD